MHQTLRCLTSNITLSDFLCIQNISLKPDPSECLSEHPVQEVCLDHLVDSMNKARKNMLEQNGNKKKIILPI